MKNLCILGSTGSIGKNTLKIVEMFPERFSVKALTGARNIDLLSEQIKKFKPEIAVVLEEEGVFQLREKLGPFAKEITILAGTDGFKAAATHNPVDMVVSSMVGAAGLLPTLAAISAGKEIALANKETLVMAGEIVMGLAKEKNVSILPVDSEHSAIFQCISGQRPEDISNILLTASGGPFRNKPQDEFSKITLADALNHPTWEMGKKISIDSATLMNKGLEVIEAKFLFGISVDQIEVVVHPQSVVHSMVSYVDGSVIAQLGMPDMKGAISYAMGYPERLQLKQPIPEFANIGALTFEKPDMGKFPCLKMAYDACEKGATFPAVLNAANEICVDAFLNKRLAFIEIPEYISQVLSLHKKCENPGLAQILEADKWAREKTLRMIKEK